MGLKTCPQCDNQVDESVNECPLCGASLSSEPVKLDREIKQAQMWLNLSLLVIAVSLPLVGIGFAGPRFKGYLWMGIITLAGLIGLVCSLIRLKQYRSSLAQEQPNQSRK